MNAKMMKTKKTKNCAKTTQPMSATHAGTQKILPKGIATYPSYQ